MELNELRKTAEAATPGPWEVWKNVHCDPVVVPAGKPWEGITDQTMPFEKITGLSTAPDDYGRANLEYIATFDPSTVLALLSRLERAEARVKLLESGIVSELVVTSVHSASAIGTTVSGISEDLLKLGYDGLTERLEQAEQAVQRAREVAESSDDKHLTMAILEALDGDGRG